MRIKLPNWSKALRRGYTCVDVYKATSKNELAWNGIPYYGNPRTARSGGSWL